MVQVWARPSMVLERSNVGRSPIHECADDAPRADPRAGGPAARALRALRRARSDDPDTAGLDVDARDDWADVDDAYEYADQLDDELDEEPPVYDERVSGGPSNAPMGRPPKVQIDEDEFAALFSGGMTGAADLAAHLGCTEDRVHKLKRKLGLYTRSPYQTLTPTTPSFLPTRRSVRRGILAGRAYQSCRQWLAISLSVPARRLRRHAAGGL